MTLFVKRSLIAVALAVPIAAVWCGFSVLDHVDDAYAQWGAADMVIHYMEDHGGEWPRNWDSLAPYFAVNNGRVSGWTYAMFQSRVFIDFDADAVALRKLSSDSHAVPFDVIHATSIFGAQFDGGPNEMLHRWFRGETQSDQIATPPIPAISAGTKTSGVELLRDLSTRKTWAVGSVKAHIAVPELRARVLSPTGEYVDVHAWRHNDFDTPMMRIDGGDLLYALTESEFETLRAVAESQALNSRADR